MTDPVMRDLWEFFQSASVRPWQPGTVDCCIFLADWAVWRGLPDPAADLRGTYHDEAGFDRIIATAGGLVALVGARAALSGARALEAPRLGCIGVIGSRTAPGRQFGAIWAGGWHIRTREGVVPLTAPAVSMWGWPDA